VLLKQYYLGCLSHASYLLADEETKTAIIVDPQRDVDHYLQDAAEHGLEIKHVVLTHFHADFIAGHLELEAATGATIHMGHRARTDYPMQPIHEDDIWEFPSMRIRFIESPGHTPEMVNLIVYDLEHDPDRPHAVLTGDTLFNGDVGRPDLLVSFGYKEEELASMLYDSLQKLMRLPDETLVYPAHGAGSLCGRSLSQELVTTIGVQRTSNHALRHKDRESFIQAVTDQQPAAPRYFAHDADLNRRNRKRLEDVLATMRPMDLDTVLQRIQDKEQVVDTRDADDFASAHLPGTINIGLDGTYATWCGTVLDHQRPITIVADPGKEQESATRLGRIGYDNIEGYLEGGFPRAEKRGGLVSNHRVQATDLQDALGTVTVLDVRSGPERDEAFIPGSLHIPLDELPDRLDEVPRDQETVVHCAGGYRSSLAVSLLRRAGQQNVHDLAGGLEPYTRLEGAPLRSRIDGVEQVPPGELPRLMAQGAVLVDVREPPEWEDDHLQEAVLRPMSRFDEWKNEWDKNTLLVILCRSGNRSQKVARALQEQGNQRAVNLEGGMLLTRKTVAP
jgi:hydroxyacylglutathione hydrolase